MKKISAVVLPPRPDGPPPDVYLQKTTEKDDDEWSDEEPVPPKELHNFNLKRLKSFKQIRRKYKMSNQEKIFKSDMQTVLNEYSVSEFTLDTSLLLLVLDIAESYFVYGSKSERETMKSSAISSLMLKFFRGDRQLLDVMIQSQWHKVRKSTLFKRVYQRMYNKFFLK